MRGSIKLISFFLFGILVVALVLWFSPRNGTRRNALGDRSLATKVLAEHLARHYPGKRALVIANPFTLKKGSPREIHDYQKASLKGLREGFGKTIQLEAVVYPELRKEAQSDPSSVYVDPRTTTPLSYLVAEEAFDALARRYPNCDILVSLIGLPAQVDRTEIWRDPRLKLVLLFPDWRMVGDLEEVRRTIKSGKIAAAIMKKPGSPSEGAPMEEEVEMAFAKRFLLATSETVDDLMGKYPQLF